MMSSMVSMPTDSRTRFGSTPVSDCSAGVSWLCVVLAGWIDRQLPATRKLKDGAVERRAAARAAATNAGRAASGSERSCETCRVEFEEVLRVPGYFDALVSDEAVSPIAADASGSAGLSALLDDISRLSFGGAGVAAAD